MALALVPQRTPIFLALRWGRFRPDAVATRNKYWLPVPLPSPAPGEGMVSSMEIVN